MWRHRSPLTIHVLVLALPGPVTTQHTLAWLAWCVPGPVHVSLAPSSPLTLCFRFCPPLRKLADCAQLLEVDDMVRLAVPDSKCVYTYIQELYRSLVQKGLVKTKKK